MFTMLLKIIRYIWALPNTLLGIVIGIFTLLTGGKMTLIRGAIEFHGGLGKFLLKHCTLLKGGAAAITIGHVIHGQDENCLHRVRDHEHVHVRQYERWGPFFIPAYLLASFYLYCKGRDGYFENPFEVEAYAKEKDGIE